MGMEDDFQNDEMNDFNNEDEENNQQLPSKFGGDFDAGVEADEDTDPKKFIQQLTGKLSQSLNSYNNENGEPDTELGKYVLGMLIKQGVKGMDEKDRKEIIKKINTSETDDSETDENFNTEDELNDDDFNNENEKEQEGGYDDKQMSMESKTFNFTKKQLFECFGLGISDNSKDSIPSNKITKDTIRNRRTRPFEAPKKFK